MSNKLSRIKEITRNILEAVSLLESSKNVKEVVKCMKSPYYKSRPSLWSLRTDYIDKRIGVSKRWNYAYIRIPKCANSLVTVNLDYYLPEKGEYPRQNPRVVSKARRNFHRLRSLSKKEINFLIEEGHVFVVVRNPYHRILSAYLDKINRPSYVEKYGSGIKKAGENDLSFTSFCMWLSCNNKYKNPHWFPQVEYINTIGIHNVDYIGDISKVENIIKKIVHTLSENNPNCVHDPHFGSHDAEDHKTYAANKTFEYYNEKSIEIIQNLYRDDFELLGYDASDIGR